MEERNYLKLYKNRSLIHNVSGRKKDYIVHGPVPLVPIVDGTAGQQLFNALSRFSHLQAALVNAENGKTLSYKQLLQNSCRVANSLKAMGLNHNGVVSIFSENIVEYYYPLLASLFLGIPVAPLSPDYVEGELNHAASISRPQVIFCSKATVDKALSLQRALKFEQKIIVMDSDVDIDGVESLNQFANMDKNVNDFVPTNFDPNERVALIMCSSGTTGLPKGAMITHKNLTVRFAQFMDPVIGIMEKPKTKFLSVFPMCHIGGLGFALAYLVLGFENVSLKKFSFRLFLQSIQDYKIESTFIAPPIMTMLAKSPLVEQYDLSSLKEIGFGAAPLPKETIKYVQKRLPHVKEIRQAYGLTETTMAVTYSPRGDPKIGSVGKLFPFTLAKVRDVRTHDTLEPYQNGELCFKGGLIVKGYTCETCQAKNIIDENGWFPTGDIGYYDDDEHFYVVDRLKDIIKYKGYQVSPAEVEAILMQHPKIKDAAVIGIADEIAGQLSRAYVVKQPNEKLTEQEVIDFVAGQISYQKHLHGGVKFIDSIPRTSSGKVVRSVLHKLNGTNVAGAQNKPNSFNE